MTITNKEFTGLNRNNSCSVFYWIFYLQNLFYEPNYKEMKANKDFEFILGMSGFFVLVFLLFNLKMLLIIPALLAVIGLSSEMLSGKIAAATRSLLNLVWNIAAKFILSLFFLFVLLPIAITQRLMGKDS